MDWFVNSLIENINNNMVPKLSHREEDHSYILNYSHRPWGGGKGKLEAIKVKAYLHL